MTDIGVGAATIGGAEEDSTKVELQRQMEEARESISQTVTEIKETVTDQYESVKETVAQTFDWREQFRRHPVEWSIGALVVGLAVGYKVADTLEETKAFERLHDALEPLVARIAGGMSDIGDWLTDQLPRVEDVIVPTLVASATPVLLAQLNDLLGLDLGDIFKGSGGKKAKGKSSKGKRKKASAKKGKRKDK